MLISVTGDNFDAAAWSTVESNVGIICASLPTLKPLISRLFPHFLTSAFTGQDNSTGLSRNNDWNRDAMKTHIITSSAQPKPKHFDLESGGMGKIKVQRDVDQIIESHVLHEAGDGDSKEELVLPKEFKIYIRKY